MTISYAQRTDLTCPECGAQFAGEVWLIVDAGERPDLLQRIREGTLHDIPCLHPYYWAAFAFTGASQPRVLPEAQ